MFRNFIMEDGIYLNYSDFRHNQIIRKNDILSKENPDQLEFIKKILETEEFSVKISGTVSKIKPKSVWAYVQNNALHLNYREQFFRVTIFGTICFFPALVKVQSPAIYNPQYGFNSGSIITTETRELIMNFYDGDIFTFDFDRVKNLICRDKFLCEDLNKLKRRIQNEQIYRFIHKFNEAHQAYYLK